MQQERVPFYRFRIPEGVPEIRSKSKMADEMPLYYTLTKAAEKAYSEHGTIGDVALAILDCARDGKMESRDAHKAREWHCQVSDASKEERTMIQGAFKIACEQLEEEEYTKMTTMLESSMKGIRKDQEDRFNSPHAKRLRCTAAWDAAFGPTGWFERELYGPPGWHKSTSDRLQSLRESGFLDGAEIMFARDYYNRDPPYEDAVRTIDLIVRTRNGYVMRLDTRANRSTCIEDGMEIGFDLWNGKIILTMIADTANENYEEEISDFTCGECATEEDGAVMWFVADSFYPAALQQGACIELYSDCTLPAWVVPPHMSMDYIFYSMVGPNASPNDKIKWNGDSP